MCNNGISAITADGSICARAWSTRPSWESVYYRYPKEYDRSFFRTLEYLTDIDFIRSFVNNIRPSEHEVSAGDFSRSIGYPENKFTKEEISAIRVSMALSVFGMMRISLREKIKTANANDVVTILTGPLRDKTLIRRVNLLQEWLSGNSVWGAYDRDVKYPKTVADIREKINDQKGVCIISKPNSNAVDGYATLWVGDNIIGGHEYLDGSRFVYFWELKGRTDSSQRLFEAQLKAAKILYDRHICVDNKEHSISIFKKYYLSGNAEKIWTGEYFLADVKHGNNDNSVAPDEKDGINELAAIVHTHAETISSHNIERELSDDDKIMSYVKNVPVSLITSDGVLKTIQTFVDPDKNLAAKRSVKIKLILKQFKNAPNSLKDEEKKILFDDIGEPLEEYENNDLKRDDYVKTYSDHYDGLLREKYIKICNNTELKIFEGKV